MKRIILIVLTIMLLSITLSFADAIPSSKTYCLEGGNVRFEAPCPSANGIHDMRRRGTGTVYLGSWGHVTGVIISEGPAWQCTKCLEVIVTEHDPLEGINIGKYATAATTAQIPGIHTSLFVLGYGIQNSQVLPGFQFGYSK